MPRASLLLACLPLAGCAGPAEGTPSGGSLDDVPSFAEPRPEAPDWVRNHAPAFWNDFGTVDAARGAPFARAALELELPATHCDEPPCRLRARSYVRFEPAGDAISLMPHCSVVAEDSELLHSASSFGPWRLASGAPARILRVLHDAAPPVSGDRGASPVSPAWRTSPNQISIPAGTPRFGRGATQSWSSVAPAPGSVRGKAKPGPPGSAESREARFWPPSGQSATAGAREPAFQTRSGQFEPLRRPSIFEARDPIAVGEDEGGERALGQGDERASGEGDERGLGRGDERGSGQTDADARGPGEGDARGFGEGGERGPGDLDSFAGEPVELIGEGGARLRIRVERWWEPSAPPLAAWSAWLYTRSLVRERARSFGIELGLFGGEDCEEHASLPQVHDVCWSSSGGPLSVLMDPTVPRYLDESVPFYLPSEAEWVRRRVVSPASAGHWQLFCGRLDWDQLRLSCDVVERRVRPFADELAANGVNLTRFFAGAALVFGGRYYPQLSLDALATVADCLGEGDELGRELGRIAAEPGLDFPNRFRVEYVRARLTGRELGVAELRAWVPGPATDADDETRLEIDAADAACVQGLTGPMSLRSAG